MRASFARFRRWMRELGRPFSWLKPLLPRSLLRRAILIMVLPLAMTQALAAYVFYNHVWTLITERLVFALVTDLQSFVESYEVADTLQARQRLISGASRKRIAFREAEGPVLVELDRPRRFSVLDQRLRAELDATGWDYSVDVRVEPGWALITLASAALENRHYRFTVNRKRLFSGISYSFVMVLMLLALLSVTISLAFLRNQVRPIRRLSSAAQRYGKGEADVPLPLEGAAEVRAATRAFVAMRQRISSTLSQRTSMLNGISHDLRTPLTRLRLGLEFVEPKETREPLIRDLEEMEAMVEAYLAFARGDTETRLEPLAIAALVREAAQQSFWPDLEIELGALPHTVLLLKRDAILRVFQNLISNAQRYAERLEIRGERRGPKIWLWFDDDGPGIPLHQREQALRPFQRLDDARTPRQDTRDGGTGLGLAIAQDLVTGLGGQLSLDDSPLGGLRVLIELPLEREV